MTRLVLMLVVAVILRGPVLAQDPARSPADQDYAAFKAALAARPPAQPAEMGAQKYYAWMTAKRVQARDEALAFMEKYPADPRRWELVLDAVGGTPLFALSWGPDADQKGAAAAVVDEAAKAAWEARAAELKAALMAAPDARLELKEGIDWARFVQDFRAISAAKKSGQPFDYSPMRVRFDAHLAKYGALQVAGLRAKNYLTGLENNVPGAALDGWRHLLDSSSASARAMAEEQVKLATKPLELAFTAVDGRPVDLASLRGKVVLVDFWATWCGPCVAEIPNIKRAFAAYHDKGFEIVGISLENARLLPDDSPEQISAKHDQAKKHLADYTAQAGMTWPQYYDGKHWKNDLSTRFGIRSIPAMFLLDQDGRVVSTNARGPALEAEVKRLLKL